MKTFLIAEMNYDKEASEALRNHIIALRDAALTSGHMEWAVTLSHTVAFMATAIEEMYR